MLERIDQVFRVQFQLLEANFFELLIRRKIGLLNQFFQPLSVATMFGLQTANFFAQRGVIYLIHQAPPDYFEITYSPPPTQSASGNMQQFSSNAVDFLTPTQQV